MLFRLVEQNLLESGKEVTTEVIIQIMKEMFKKDTAKNAVRDFILPDGTFVSTGDAHTSHAFASMMVEEKLEELGYDVSKLSKDFLEDIGCIHVNKAGDDYILLPNQMITKRQGYSLEDWINGYFDEAHRKITVITVNKGSRVFSFPEFDGEEVVDRIKMFYTKGIFEDINLKKIKKDG